MKEPLQRGAGESAPVDIDALLRTATKPVAMTPSQRARSAARIARLSAVPVAAGVFASLSGVAAAAGGAALAGLGAIAYLLLRVPAMPADGGVSSASGMTIQPIPVLIAAAAETVQPPLIGVAFADNPGQPNASGRIAEVAPVLRETKQPSPITQVGSALRSHSEYIAGKASRAQVFTAPPAATAEAEQQDSETALRERATRIIAEDPAGALVWLDRHARLYPHGLLATERELDAIDCLIRLGRHAEARARADALLAQPSGKLYRKRIDQLMRQKP